MLLKLFKSLYDSFDWKGYLQEAFGYTCVDAGYVPGAIGGNIGSYVLMRLRKDYIWPIASQYTGYDEADLFDVIEFLYDHVSCPTHGKNHPYNECGWHYDLFDKRSGQDEY